MDVKQHRFETKEQVEEWLKKHDYTPVENGMWENDANFAVVYGTETLQTHTILVRPKEIK